MARDWFDDYGNPENRKTVVARELGRIGLSIEDKGSVLPGAEGERAVRLGPPTPDHLAHPHEFFRPDNRNWPMSGTLADLMHYHPPAVAGAPVDDVDAETRWLEEQTRR